MPYRTSIFNYWSDHRYTNSNQINLIDSSTFQLMDHLSFTLLYTYQESHPKCHLTGPSSTYHLTPTSDACVHVHLTNLSQWRISQVAESRTCNIPFGTQLLTSLTLTDHNNSTNRTMIVFYETKTLRRR